MSLVTPSQVNPNDAVAAASVNTPVNQIASVVNGNIDSSNIADNSVSSSKISTNAITADKLATSAITLGYAQITANFSTASLTPVQITGLTSNVTIPTGGRRIKITGYFSSTATNTATNGCIMTIWDGAVGTGTQLQRLEIDQNSASSQIGGTCLAIVTPSSGSKTYNIGLNVVGSGTATINSATTSPAFILVEAI